MNSLFFLQFISENTLFSSALTQTTKFMSLLALMTLSFHPFDTNLQSTCMKGAVDSEFVDSIWIVSRKWHVENLFEDTLKAFYDFKITQKIVWSKVFDM